MPISSDTQQQRRQQWLLQLLEIKSSVFYAGQHCGDWQSSPPEGERCAFHLVLAGQCAWRTTSQEEPKPLYAGEGLLFLQPKAHELIAWPPSEEPLSMADSSVHLVCGYVEFATPFSAWILQQLPTSLTFSAQQQVQLSHLFELLDTELNAGFVEPNNLILHKLCELLVCYVLQDAFKAAVDTRSYGIVGLMQDSVYSVVLDALWEQPQLPWDTAKMAELVHMSPASFHRRFKLLTGMGPAHLLLIIRIYHTKLYLREAYSLEAVAEKVGYGSASALSHAFRRHIGMNPTQWREQHKLTRLR